MSGILNSFSGVSCYLFFFSSCQKPLENSLESRDSLAAFLHNLFAQIVGFNFVPSCD